MRSGGGMGVARRTGRGTGRRARYRESRGGGGAGGTLEVGSDRELVGLMSEGGRERRGVPGGRETVSERGRWPGGEGGEREREEEERKPRCGERRGRGGEKALVVCL